MTEIRDNSGSLSKNDKKTQENHPDVRGKATINGVEYWISGWKKDGQFGKFTSLSFTPKTEKPATIENAEVSDDEEGF